MFKLLKSKIEFKPSFFVLLIVMLLLRLEIDFIILFLSVLFHETTHILTAAVFGIKCEKVIVYPIGHRAILKDIHKLNIIKRLSVILSGPVFNILVFVVFLFIKNDLGEKIRSTNLALGIFNLLPAYPLDGGRALGDTIAYFNGVLKGIKISHRISRVIVILLFAAGGLQLILYPFNVSLLCISVYIHKINKKERYLHIFEFYNKLLNKEYNCQNRKIKKIRAEIGENTKFIIDRLSFDYDIEIELYEENSFICRLSESELIKLYFEGITALDEVKNFSCAGNCKAE